MRTRYVKSADEIARLQAINAAPAFLESVSLSMTFLTDPEVVRELLPPPLAPAAEPRASVAVYRIGRSNCVGPFEGASINLACRYNGEDGLYCLTMPMSTDTAIIFGRELYAEPKKQAECRLDERGRFVHGTVTRHGVTYIELTGTFDEPLQDIDRASLSHHYYFKYLPAADGRGLAFDPQLVRVTHLPGVAPRSGHRPADRRDRGRRFQPGRDAHDRGSGGHGPGRRIPPVGVREDRRPHRLARTRCRALNGRPLRKRGCPRGRRRCHSTWPGSARQRRGSR
jgi:hypothetical protein